MYDYFELVKLYEKSKKEINNLKCKNYDLEKRIDKAIEILGKYKHYSVPDEKQNSDNEELVNNAYEILKGDSNE